MVGLFLKRFQGFNAMNKRFNLNKRVSIAIIGATGSIGKQAIDVISAEEKRYYIETITGGKNREEIEGIAQRYSPKFIALAREDDALKLESSLKRGRRRRFPQVRSGEKGLIETIERSKAEVMILAIPGVAGILPSYYAVKKRRRVAIASKEAIVALGELLIEESEKSGAKLFPIDSEASAIFQCLLYTETDTIKRVLLTASGGPFLKMSQDELERVTPDMALRHPVWKMGIKVTIDSANLLNKGFELIEIGRLFNIPLDRISIIIHPESIIHSMIEMIDGSIIAVMSYPDMRIPISYALSFPHRFENRWPLLDFSKGISLNMRELKREESKAYSISFYVGEKGGLYPSVLVSADEIAVKAFLARRISFPEIVDVCAEVVERFDRDGRNVGKLTITEVMDALKWGKRVAEECIKKREIKRN